MTRPPRLTLTAARTLTCGELLNRVEAEGDRWNTRPPRTDPERAAYAEFSRILHAYLSPADALQAARDTLEGRPSAYWETRIADLPEPEAGG